MIGRFGRCFRGFVLPVSRYCSCSVALGCRYTPKLLHLVVSGARFLTGVVFESDIAHRRSVAVLCMLYKIGCNPMHPLHSALPVSIVLVRVTRGALVAHGYTCKPRCRTSQYRTTFILLCVHV